MAHRDTLSAKERMRRTRARRRGETVEPAPKIQRGDAIRTEMADTGKSRAYVYRQHPFVSRPPEKRKAAPSRPKLDLLPISEPELPANVYDLRTKHLAMHTAAAKAKRKATLAAKRAAGTMEKPGPVTKVEIERQRQALALGREERASLPARALTSDGRIYDMMQFLEGEHAAGNLPPGIDAALWNGQVLKDGPELDAFVSVMPEESWGRLKQDLIRQSAGKMVADGEFDKWRRRFAAIDLSNRATKYDRKARKIRRTKRHSIQGYDGTVSHVGEYSLGASYDETGGLKFGHEIGWWDNVEEAYLRGAHIFMSGGSILDNHFPADDVWGNPYDDPTDKSHLLYKGGLMRDAWEAGWNQQAEAAKAEAKRYARWFGDSLPEEFRNDPVKRGELQSAYAAGADAFKPGQKTMPKCPHRESRDKGPTLAKAWTQGWQEARDRAARGEESVTDAVEVRPGEIVTEL